MPHPSGSGENLFAPIAGDVADVAGDRIARQPSSKLLDNRNPFRLRDLKMGGAGHPVELVEVVGQDTKVGETREKLGQHAALVVHPPKQNTLAEQEDAFVDKLPNSLDNCAVDFCRVIDVDDHYDRQASCVAPREKIMGDSLGHDDRHAGV